MLLIDMLKEAKRRCMGLPLEAEKLEPPTQRLAETYLSGMSGEYKLIFTKNILKSSNLETDQAPILIAVVIMMKLLMF